MATAHLDVTDEVAVKARFAQLPELDIVVCAAGVGTFASIVNASSDEVREMLDVHVFGSFLCAREALRQLALSLEGGAVPYMVLGQLAWFVREKLPMADARRVPAAIDALFRTDLELKSSGGDPRVLLERLVVELCGRGGTRL